jgi:hypothetical protein
VTDTDELLGNHTVVRQYPLTATTSFDEGEPVAPHTCIAKKVYGPFSQSEGSDDDSQSSSDEETPLNRQPAVASHLRRSPRLVQNHPVARSSSTVIPTSAVTMPTSLQRSDSHQTISTYPAAIWQVPWIPPNGAYVGRVAQDNFPGSVYEIATDGISPEVLDISGDDVEDLAAKLKLKIGDAVDHGDFTDLLSPERSLYL